MRSPLSTTRFLPRVRFFWQHDEQGRPLECQHVGGASKHRCSNDNGKPCTKYISFEDIEGARLGLTDDKWAKVKRNCGAKAHNEKVTSLLTC